MKKVKKKLALSKETLSRVHGAATNSDLYCTLFGMCASHTQVPVELDHALPGQY